MKIYLDDERQTPQGWIRTYWPDEVIALLKAGGVEEISLDHDLGDDLRGTGYDVILWIEEAVALNGFRPPRIHIHSANASAVEKMRAGVQAIDRLARNNGCRPSTDNTGI
ncbi:cyclic-phosphate processing receiver domain-containing protein [Pseudomonas protegens]|uniref:cyclic-phosphate processing receiver domain-containing protein n=1 Tax=Pseudomonas protegens TaxID=380021 RepID=UPI002936E8AC|nr:cyclic-phosphate processing receiver domain-containing protein [Pseudomonas protegens]WOE81994.1 cyclic-phosphate processing receiver domain-containing protein [Pseudomonas protegens]